MDSGNSIQGRSFTKVDRIEPKIGHHRRQVAWLCQDNQILLVAETTFDTTLIW